MAVVVEESIEISRRPEDVFTYMLDPRNFHKWDRSVVSAHRNDPGPLKVGSKTTVVHRMGPFKAATIEEVVEFHPPHQFANRGVSGPLAGVSRIAVEPLDGGRRSRLTTTLDIEARGLGKLFLPLARLYGRRTVPKLVRKLKELLDGGGVIADGRQESSAHP